jgi:hypothetical protein
VGTQEERGAKQHARYDERNHAGREPLGRERRAREKGLWILLAVSRCDERRISRGLSLLRCGVIQVFDFRDEAIAFARNRIHENRLFRGIAEGLPQLFHGSVYVRVLVDVDIRGPEAQAQRLARHNLAGFFEER